MHELKKRQGFETMDPERRRALASVGGKAAHAAGKAHKWTPDEARAAGAKGGRRAFENRVIREAEARNFNPDKPIPDSVVE